ncbi:protein FRA10AC1 [Turdus rufiventris]|nr:protein FRA10AC1 [Turdus rufiventris]
MEPNQLRLSAAAHGHGGYDSDFSDEESGEKSLQKTKRIQDDALLKKPFQKAKQGSVVHRQFAADECDREKRLAKKYYDKLFKEYCIADLSRYKENKFGFRWRHEKEVISGKGQFSCGNKHCDENEGLKSWEVNFGYVEHGEKRNALVKLNQVSSDDSDDSDKDSDNSSAEDGPSKADFWKGPLREADEKSREEEFEEYFQDLFL